MQVRKEPEPIVMTLSLTHLDITLLTAILTQVELDDDNTYEIDEVKFAQMLKKELLNNE